jgi:hypothetical protein
VTATIVLISLCTACVAFMLFVLWNFHRESANGTGKSTTSDARSARWWG